MCGLFHLYQSRGLDLYREGRPEEAIAEWRVAADLDPEDGYVPYNIGVALSELGQEEAAIEEWRKAVRLEPDHKEAAKSLAQSLSEAGLLAEAAAVVRASLRHHPDNGVLYCRLGCYLRDEADRTQDKPGWEAAAAAFYKSLELDPADTFTLRSLAHLQWQLGQKRDAIKTLQAAVAVEPDNLEVHKRLAGYQIYAGDLRGGMRTIHAIYALPETDELNQYVAEGEQLTQRVLLIGAGLAVVLVGGWIWYRRRG